MHGPTSDYPSFSDDWPYALARRVARDTLAISRAGAWTEEERYESALNALLLDRPENVERMVRETEIPYAALRTYLSVRIKDLCERSFPSADAMHGRLPKEAMYVTEPLGIPPIKRNGKVPRHRIFEPEDRSDLGIEPGECRELVTRDDDYDDVEERLALQQVLAALPAEARSLLAVTAISETQAEAADALQMSLRTYKRRLQEARDLALRLYYDHEAPPRKGPRRKVDWSAEALAQDYGHRPAEQRAEAPPRPVHVRRVRPGDCHLLEDCPDWSACRWHRVNFERYPERGGIVLNRRPRAA